MVLDPIIVVGGGGAVGQELVCLLLQEGVSPELLTIVGARPDRTVICAGHSFQVQPLADELFKDVCYVVFTAGAAVSKAWVPRIPKHCWVIDNTSAFRRYPNVPLIIPEINGDALNPQKHHLIASPNCSTTIALMALFPLHKAFGLKRFFASTYQAVSGSGQKGIQELRDQICNPLSPNCVYPHPIAFNVIPCVDQMEASFYTKEEEKMLFESQKILQLPDLRVSCTCVRVPVYRSHSVAIHAEFEAPVDLEKAKKALRSAHGLTFFEDPLYPMPINCSERRCCGVGRLRRDSAFDNGLALWAVGDQLWKGAALNVMQILQLIASQ